MSRQQNSPVLVSAANGRTGRAVVTALKKSGKRVRAFIRDSAQQESLSQLGVDEFALGDMLNAESIQNAAEGASAIVHIGPPMHPQEVEITQGFINAAAAVAVPHLVYYSVMHPLRRDVRHHRLKLDAEESVIESGVPYTIVQPCRYMQHLELIWSKVIQEGVHGMPFSVRRRFNVVDLVDLADAVAVIAGNPGHFSATYELAGPDSLSQIDMAAVLSEKLGTVIRAFAVDLDAMAAAATKRGVPADKIEQMRIMNAHYDQHGFLGNANVLRWLLGREPTCYPEYVDRLIAEQS